MSVIAERSTGALDAAGTLFTALGWTMLGLDAACNIQYCSSPIADLLDDELRQLLQQGEVREGWRTVLRGTDGATRQVSVAAAPCNVDGIRYVVVLRPADDDLLLGDAAPTFFFGVVARSPAMLDIVALLDAVRATNVPLILTGEEGTGKKTLARALHAASPRRAGRFVAIDCAVLPPELLSFDVPRDGTLFLNHVERMPLELQAKLLPILEESGARIVAATKSEIRRSVEAGTFRDDVARLLRTIPIEVPPLRARTEDVDPLAQVLLARAGARHGRKLRLSPDATRYLLSHTWPGNVRELETAMEHATVVARSATIEPEDLPSDVVRLFDDVRYRIAERGELQTIRAALDTHHWNREATARSLGMSRTTLWRKMRELRLV
jgi:DNA-binding NtrC family response regulator